MSEGYCPVGDMPKEWCAHCKGLKTPEEEQEELDQGLIRLAERLGRETT